MQIQAAIAFQAPSSRVEVSRERVNWSESLMKDNITYLHGIFDTFSSQAGLPFTGSPGFTACNSGSSGAETSKPVRGGSFDACNPEL